MILKTSPSPVYIHLLLALLLLLTPGIDAGSVETIKGVYGNPKALMQQQDDLGELGINAIFVRHKLIDDTLMAAARKQGLKVFAEFATLNGKGYVEQHPEAWAINEMGEPVEAASWFMGVCPTEPGFRKYRFDDLRELLSNHAVDGVWMDYVHWHAQFEEPQPILPETCFCSSCLNTFSNASGITLPEGSTTETARYILDNHDAAWRDWGCSVIIDWAAEMKAIIRELRPDALLGLYHCPWTDDEFDAAQRRILGLDYDLLRDVIDVFSPMVYHERMGRDPGWVGENVRWLSDRLDIMGEGFPAIWPIVQAQNKSRIISAGEFETVLRNGLTAGSTGVMMFTAGSIAEDAAKREIMKRIYTTTR